MADPTKQKQSILFASSKYGFTALKSKAEAWCVKFLELNTDTAIDHLLYADANSLSLLKKSPVLMKEVMQEVFEKLETLKRKYDG
ncbi:hypothetical protein ACHAWO_013110 [Cyclotella atomus]|uniref:Uncharacterized protein n=1 Tax=Cyclotella atomus TaxID=382360 RepID=A0ABD3Q7L4_9STRA